MRNLRYEGFKYLWFRVFVVTQPQRKVCSIDV